MHYRDPRLDRRVQFDERSRRFPIRALLAADAKPRSFTWSCAVQLDQGNEGACVGFSIAQEAAARPVIVPDITNAIALEVYRRAQELDEFPETPPEGGTSVLAGAKAATERGWYTEYRWGFGLDDGILALGHHGPVVLGTNWYTGMMEPDVDGFIRPVGIVEGGHAIVLRAVNVKKRYVVPKNTWGPDWGVNGDCRLSFEDLDALLHQEGELMIPVKRRRPNVLP